MSDYDFDTSVGRDQMASKLSQNEEQFIYVITSAVNDVDFEDALKEGEIDGSTNQQEIVHRLRALADAIESGNIT